jgi:hypothetical protein
MIEVSSAGSTLRRYLLATRGEGTEYLIYPTDRLSRFFVDCLETFEPAGLDTSRVRLVHINSHRGDIEHIHDVTASHVIFDQSMMEILGLATDSLNRTMSLGAGDAAPFPSLLSAFYAYRHLALGMPDDAIFDASLCRTLRRSEPRPYTADEQRRNVWVQVQSCFTIGHEVMHARLPSDGSSDGSILAQLLAKDYAARMTPMLAAMDKAGPGGSYGDWAGQWRLTNGAEDTFRPVVEAPRLSWVEQLRWIAESQDSFGQEVLCDYGAALMVMRNLGGDLLPPDEILLACYVALVTRMCMQVVEKRILAYTSRCPRLEDSVRFGVETRTRIQFLRLALRPLCRNSAYKDLMDAGLEEAEVMSLVDARWSSLEGYLSRLDSAWTRPLLKLAANGSRVEAVRGMSLPDRESPPDLDMSSLREVSSFVRTSTGISLVT